MPLPLENISMMHRYPMHSQTLIHSKRIHFKKCLIVWTLSFQDRLTHPSIKVDLFRKVSTLNKVHTANTMSKSLWLFHGILVSVTNLILTSQLINHNSIERRAGNDDTQWHPRILRHLLLLDLVCCVIKTETKKRKMSPSRGCEKKRNHFILFVKKKKKNKTQ